MTKSDLPIVDFAPFYTDGDPGVRAVAGALGRACREVGFFYLAGSRVPDALRAAVFAAAHGFFAAPAAVKTAVSIDRSSHNRGYVGLAVEALDPARGRDNKEAFNVGLELPPDDPDRVADRPFRGPNLWPDVPGFRDTLLAYYDAMLGLGRHLHRALATDLGLAPDFFADKLARPLATLRLLRYPPRPAAAARDRLGAGTHTDYGNLTLLATDGVGGLEVRRRDGTWVAAPHVPGAFVCNIGDCLMRWTNDVYVSTPHRVVSPAGRERFSVAFFLDADPDAEVACLPTCRGDGTGPKYPPVTVAAYLRGRLEATYGPEPRPGR